ncbi:MAG TPA: sugar ABC transporter permease, partial [Clostridiales bacterium]|nr:sugar ABC transporter permease [Clostridiales bacterium]
KRFVQTVSYLPHFISWVVVSGIIFAFLSEDGGVINVLLQSVFSVEKPVSFLTDAKYFWGIAVISDAWKEFGWWAIIFISAITVIDPNLYEAASIDGAGRLSKIKNITLPGIKGAICIVLILSIGNLLGGGLSGSNFEQSYLMGNGLNNDASEVIQTYVLKTGLVTARYSFATAVSIFQSIFSVILVLLSNLTLKKVRGESLF